MRLAASVRRQLRWIALATLLLILLYPVSLGPTSYLLFRDATPRVPFAAIYHRFYRPLWAIGEVAGFADLLSDYQDSCILLAAHHDGRDTPPLIIPPSLRDDLPE